ncbi:MAG: DUF1893 domain-containing protein [Spirochaetia bacterium]|nr:DUF1893 domain-containing protein [Spirochaetia bacterium]
MEIDDSTYSLLAKRELPPLVSLQMVDIEGFVIFETTGKWLYPLFELEQFLIKQNIEPKSYFLHDRIAGRAAAALTYRLGFRYVKAHTMSSLATSLYDRLGVTFSYDVLVDSILCQTEKMFEDIDDIDYIYDVIDKRRIKSN